MAIHIKIDLGWFWEYNSILIMLERAFDKRVLGSLSLVSNLRTRKRLKEEIGVGQNDWTVYDSSFVDYYVETFAPVLEGTDLFEFLGAKQPLTVLDLMASTEAIESLFIRADFLCLEQKLGISVSREDKRSNYTKGRDQRLGITHIVGDIQEGGVWREIEKTLGGRKVDLIIERGEGGLSGILKDIRLYLVLIKRAWELLAKDGMLLIETPEESLMWEDMIRDWERVLKENNVKVDFRTGYSRFGLLRIEKSANSPLKLPFPA